MRRTPRALALALIAPLAFGLAACSSSDGGAKASEESSSASGSITPKADASEDATDGEDAGSAAGGDASEGGDASGGGSGSGEEIGADEFAKVLSKGQTKEPVRYTMKIQGPGGEVAIKGGIDPSQKDTAMFFTMTLGGQKIETRILGDATYIKMGPKWMKAPTDPTMQEQNDPRGQLTDFSKAIESATFVGEEKVAGEKVRHYRAVLNAGKLSTAAAQGKKTVDVDFYLDGKDRVTLMEMDAGDGTMVFDFYDFGKPVVVKAPPADQVIDQP